MKLVLTGAQVENVPSLGDYRILLVGQNYK